MIAEIYGKISNSGSNLNDRLEDNLTGNVFGSLRYLSFNNVMKSIFKNAIYPETVGNVINSIQSDYWNNNIMFWPYDDEGELDAIIEFDDVIIGIEVKYLSSLSSDDGMDYSVQLLEDSGDGEQKESIHQLSRESRIISKIGGNKKKILIFIANDFSCRDIYENTIKRNLIEKGVSLGYLSWQAILVELTKLKLNNEFENLIIEDLIKLLNRKGFDQFKDMKLDYDFTIENSYYNFDYEAINLLEFDENIAVKGDLFYEFK